MSSWWPFRFYLRLTLRGLGMLALATVVLAAILAAAQVLTWYAWPLPAGWREWGRAVIFVIVSLLVMRWTAARVVRGAATLVLPAGQWGGVWAATQPRFMTGVAYCTAAVTWLWVVLVTALLAILAACLRGWPASRLPPSGMARDFLCRLGADWTAHGATSTATLAAVTGLALPVLLLQGRHSARVWERRRWLLEQPATFTPDPPQVANGPGRRIVILCDGTGNAPGQMEDGRPAPTNIAQMAAALRSSEAQIVWYDPGVGTGTSRVARTVAFLGRLLPASLGAFLIRMWAAIEGATGSGISENITQGYAGIARHYRPGDEIFLLGFSRGAYTARCIAGMISRCGLLRPEHADRAPDAFALYVGRPSQDWPEGMHPAHCQTLPGPGGARVSPPVRFLGVFDTVASLGVPLWGWWFTHRGFWRNAPLDTEPANVTQVCHALAMDERRSQFLPTLFTERHGAAIEQVWFRGDHCDIGGGHADRGLSDITLAWMARRAARAGLRLAPGLLAGLKPDPLKVPGDRIRETPAWAAMGSWPRWAPVARDRGGSGGYGTLHTSVRERAALMWYRHNRADLLYPGAPGMPASIDLVVGSNRQWNRTGVVLEQGRAYRVEWTGGEWRDAFCAPGGPAGDGGEGLMRRLGRFRKRMPEAPYMQLCGTVAHARSWPLREYGIGTLLTFLFRRDPWEMRAQVFPLGEALGTVPSARSVLLRVTCPPGLLYLFANDLWQTVGNNTGALTLRLSRADKARPGEPVFTLRDPGQPPPIRPAPLQPPPGQLCWTLDRP